MDSIARVRGGRRIGGYQLARNQRAPAHQEAGNGSITTCRCMHSRASRRRLREHEKDDDDPFALLRTSRGRGAVQMPRQLPLHADRHCRASVSHRHKLFANETSLATWKPQSGT